MKLHPFAPLGLLVAVLLTGPAGVSLAQDYDHDEVIEERFKLAAGGTLFLDSDLGSVIVEGGDRSDVVVRVLKGVDNVSRSEAEELFDRFAVRFDEDADRLEIYGDYDRPGGRFNWGRRGLRVHYEIRVPEDVNVDLKTAGGSIHVDRIAGAARLKTSGGAMMLSDIGGPVDASTSGGSIQGRRLGDRADLHTSGGAINLDDVGGPVKARTSGGSISMDGVRGSVDASTSGGGIRLREVAGPVNASTSGGSIEAEILGQPDDDMTLKTSGGSVTVHLDPSVRADIDAKVSGGSVSTDFPVTVQGTLKRTQLQGEINGGGPLLTLRTSGGSVRIREN